MNGTFIIHQTRCQRRFAQNPGIRNGAIFLAPNEFLEF